MASLQPGSRLRCYNWMANLGRNAGVQHGQSSNDLRVAKRVYFTERFSMDLMVDMFNIANRDNVAAVSPLFQQCGAGYGGLRSAAVSVRAEVELVGAPAF